MRSGMSMMNRVQRTWVRGTIMVKILLQRMLVNGNWIRKLDTDKRRNVNEPYIHGVMTGDGGQFSLVRKGAHGFGDEWRI